MTHPARLGPLFLIAVAVLGAAACGSDSSGATPSPAATGTVQGAVTFVGLPCPPGLTGYQVPPCNGLYPGYHLTVFDEESKNQVAEAITDEAGFFRLELPVGAYFVRMPAGPTPDATQETRFTVRDDLIRELELAVDTGIR